MSAIGIIGLAFAALVVVMVAAIGCGVFRCPACRRVHESQEDEDACVRKHEQLECKGCGCCGKGGSK